EVECAREGRVAGRGQDLAGQAQGPLALEVVNRGDEAREVRPRIDVDTPTAPQLFHEGRVDDAELQAKLIPHLVTPLYLERGGADDHHGMDALTQDQLLHDEPALDRFAEANVIGDE